MKKDFLTIDDISKREIFGVFELAEKLKKKPYNNWLKNKNFILLFFKHSTRTRASFEIGIEFGLELIEVIVGPGDHLVPVAFLKTLTDPFQASPVLEFEEAAAAPGRPQDQGPQ